MNPLIVSHSDIAGGAARAAYRLHRALLAHGEESRMQVQIKKSDDWTVNGPKNKLQKVLSVLRPFAGNLISRLQTSDNINLHTGNWLPSSYYRQLNSNNSDVINLHWIAGETLSIEDIGRIKKPIVWTLHDMWPFCGTEHYACDDINARWRTGYKESNRSTLDNGLDLNKVAWRRKLKSWACPMHIVAPSSWLADCARNSQLFKDWPVHTIPNVLDTQCYQPLDRAFCRKVLALPQDKQIILFGAMGGSKDPRKGHDLLLEALKRLAAYADPEKLLCVIFGQSEPKNPPELPFQTQWMGHVHDDTTLALLYNAADVMAVPSRQENLPQTATEPQACACPVVAFDCTGFRDAIVHQQTGFLARAYDPADLAEGLRWILQSSERRNILGQAARERALRLWSANVVIPQYLAVYQQAIELNKV